MSGGHGAARVASPRDAAEFVDDRQIQREMIDRTVELWQQGKTAPMATLYGQLNRGKCRLRLERPVARRMTPQEIYQSCRQGVMIVGTIKNVEGAEHYHISTAAGFLITRTGVMVTNYHVVGRPDEGLAMGVRSFDGRVFGVKEVLAADPARDVAVLQLDGAGFAPLAVTPIAAPVGSVVTLISHPEFRFYALTTGVVSRYFVERKSNVGRLAITADFAKGSSGAPIFNESGAVIGMVASTESIYYDVKDGQPANLQMVIKTCVTCESILSLIGGE